MKSTESNAFKNTRNSLTRVDVFFVETDKHTFEVEDFFAMLKKLDKMFARELGRDDVVRQEKSQS